MSEQNPYNKVSWHEVQDDESGQRLDNYLLSRLKGVPKSYIYRIIRKGEVRVNKGRIKPDYKLKANDQIRVPPVKVAERADTPNPKLEVIAQLESYILFEDDSLLVVNKPSGLAVHGGSGLKFGLIEGLRSLRPQQKFLELVHRIDRDTSGIILVAKKRSALRELHKQLRDKTVEKKYLALVAGTWSKNKKTVESPLKKNTLKSGERVVRVDREGKPSKTKFGVVEKFGQATLIACEPVTGRTHQIRVHTQHAGNPIAGDDKYGDPRFVHIAEQHGLKRLFLHAHEIAFIHPKTETTMRLSAPLDDELERVLKSFRKTG
ncbi:MULTISPECIES: 23S rRNA pseudouridine(955/2504/2580) synthase RluC [Gammaproteobacteria]|uniref:23S rRNA pseudouridine(955/2504/2580) synthase RluC n=1 Tax=Gammaproteobacteria TaxID=1236 RepID=UPI000DD0D3A8|nr:MULTISPECIES: 23S rRNA pseudouridine(955/2504/2580) synthase RluC [Gammaproteobacteria]RTE87287.1 23S rRNA pseudouridine(955/2504/2580) synthase RluC [Aliidiomarina sp. B3213]TCZ92927.1 23S rRNA pseudouridine(955/2504/2580) synthase RluC [Lysobacter sp. N42]